MSASELPPARHAKFSYGRVLRLLAGGAVVAALIALLGDGFRDILRAKHLRDCRGYFKQIGLALNAYHDQYGSFPPAYVAGPDGSRLHSWRVLILPFLGHDDLYRQYTFDESWDGPHNRLLIAKMPEAYSCAESGGTDRGLTSCLAVLGRATAWPEQYSARRMDFHDGISNTIQLVECANSDVVWTEPRDLTHQEAMTFDQPTPGRKPSSAHRPDDGFLVLMGDGTVRRINVKILRDVFRSLLSINSGAPLAGVEWPADAFPEPAPLPSPRSAADFRRTDVWPHPSAPIVPGRNYVYCATFAIAWESACQQFGGRPLQLVGDPPLAQALNEHLFPASSLAEDCYLAAAGPGNDGFRKQLAAQMQRKFPGFVPVLIDPDKQDHIVQLYAYLFKALPFHVAFDAIRDPPLVFGDGDDRLAVAGFGTMNLSDDWRADQLRSQVTILDYVSDDDFVVSLRTANWRDVIVLAKMPAEKNLGAAITAVRNRIARPDPETDGHLMATESLAIPKLTFSLERVYSELVPREIVGTSLYISIAKQIIKFRIDETGAVLESESVIVGDNGHTPRFPAGQRKFIFNRPFLIYLIERDAEEPYFAAWIENPELMENLHR